MQATEIASRLEAFAGRGPGTDAERRAAGWLAGELADSGREVVVEPFWCRPNWALAHAWHVALALAGSLASIGSATVGAALLLASLLSVLSDWLTGVSLGRRLTPERASQNVVATAPTAPERARMRLILTANYDAGRAGLVYRDLVRGAASSLKRMTRGFTPGWLGWLAIAIVWLLAIAILRLEGHSSHAVGVAQFPPTVALVLALAALIELATADWSPAAGDNGTGVGVSLAIARALDAAPPAHVAVEVVLEGAGEGGRIGTRRYLRAHRKELTAANTVVLGIAACSAGHPRWWSSDGSLVPLRYARRLLALASAIATDEAYLGAAPQSGRGDAPAWRALLARLPALSVGCLDFRGLEPRSHQRTDVAAGIEPSSPDAAVQFGLLLVDAIDASLAAGAYSSRTPA